LIHRNAGDMMHGVSIVFLPGLAIVY